MRVDKVSGGFCIWEELSGIVGGINYYQCQIIGQKQQNSKINQLKNNSNAD